MENLNFLSVRFQEDEVKLVIKRYKTLVCVLWIISLVLFIGFMYLHDSIKEIKNNAKSKEIINRSTEDTISKQLNTVNSFSKFYSGLMNKTDFEDVTINDRQITLSALVNNKEEYYSTILNLENSDTFNILYLSPINNYNSKYSFKVILEAKK